MIESMQVPVQMYTDALTQPIIAPVQETLTAKQAYGAGAYFIYRSKLYNTTAAIAQGGSIVLEGSGANATPGGTVGDIINDSKAAETISTTFCGITTDATIRKLDSHIVSFSAHITTGGSATFSTATGNDIICKVPDEYKPPYDVVFPITARGYGAWTSTPYANAVAFISAAGNVYIRGKASEIQSMTNVYIDIMWPIE